MTGHRIPRLGITGGIGSGKSTALAYLRELGAAVISGDDIVHKLLQETEIAAEVGRRFGMQVLNGAAIDRPALAQVVFDDDDALGWLEALLHPHVKRVFEEWAQRYEESPRPPSLLAAEIPLLFETGMQVAFDQILLVTAPEEARRRRVAAKLTQTEFSRRAAKQLAEDEKARLADFVYENTGSRRHMKAYVGEVFATIIAQTAADAAAEAAAPEL